MRGSLKRSAAWTVVAVAGVAWPSPIIGPLDGVPFDGTLEAVGCGVLLPVLWWLTRAPVQSRLVRGLLVLLLTWKAVTTVAVQQQGLCAATFARQPLSGAVHTMRISEPHGALRSWDLRADLWEEMPRCTAILTRPLRAIEEFPAWFVNLTDHGFGPRDFVMAVRGFVTIDEPTSITVAVGPDIQMSGSIGHEPVERAVSLAAGTHPVDLSLQLRGDRWSFEPRAGDMPLWDAGLLTTAPPGALDRLVWRRAAFVTPLIVGALFVTLLALAVVTFRPGPWLAGWMAASSGVAVVMAGAPIGEWRRMFALILFASVALPVPTRLRNLRGAFLLLGVPWLAFFIASSMTLIGRFSTYSGDDWLAYQAAGYRIFMNGYWLEGGSLAFDYQPLYRWITGLLHLLFGDSSVGELYADAAWLLIGALLAFQVVRMVAGFRWGLLAGAMALATVAIGSPWYIIGRGLSEISAAGFAFLAIFFLLRARLGNLSWSAAAGAMAALMFFSRLNQLIWAVFLVAAVLPMRTQLHAWRIRARWLGSRPAVAGTYLTVFIAAVLLFMTRTWYTPVCFRCSTAPACGTTIPACGHGRCSTRPCGTKCCTVSRRWCG